MTPEEIAAWVRNHYKENPRHGAGCACLDSMIRQMRLNLAPFLPSLRARLEADDEEKKVQQGLRHILHIATKERNW